MGNINQYLLEELQKTGKGQPCGSSYNLRTVKTNLKVKLKSIKVDSSSASKSEGNESIDLGLQAVSTKIPEHLHEIYETTILKNLAGGNTPALKDDNSDLI